MADIITEPRNAQTAAPLIGRQRELTSLVEILDDVRERGTAIVIRGETRIGKSSLVYGPETSDETIPASESLSQRIGKALVRVKDAPA